MIPTLPGTARPVPLAPLDVVSHIGSLNPKDKGCQGESHEGLGLSISIHPEDWEAIARLGGNPWWEADASGLSVIEGHKALAQAGEGFKRWALDNGWAQECDEYVVSWEDEEVESRVEMVLPTHQEALEEVEYMEEGEYELLHRRGLTPTLKLLEAMGHSPVRAGKPSGDVLQSVLTVWAQEQGLDGVWWEDEYRPEVLSAPRGVIFPEKVPALSFRRVREAVVRRRGPHP